MSNANTLSQVTEALSGTYTGFDAGKITKKFGELLGAIKKADAAADACAQMLVDWGVRPEKLSNDKRYRHPSGENMVDKLLFQLMVKTYNDTALTDDERKLLVQPTKSLSEADEKDQKKLKSRADNFIRSSICSRMANLLTAKGDTQYTKAKENSKPRGAQQPDGHINTTGKQPHEVVGITVNSMIGYLQKQDSARFNITKVIELFNQINAELNAK